MHIEWLWVGLILPLVCVPLFYPVPACTDSSIRYKLCGHTILSHGSSTNSSSSSGSSPGNITTLRTIACNNSTNSIHSV